MSPTPPRPRARRAFGLAALCAAASLLSIGGCDIGGTSSEGGNPGITLEFRRDGKPARFQGYLRFVAAGSNADPPRSNRHVAWAFGPNISERPALT